MKKIVKLVLLFIFIFSLNGCFKLDDLEEADILTTVYPVEFLTNVLYGENSNVHSIYPNSTNPEEYKLTSKQITDYSGADIFVYNGLTGEKEIAKNFINKNKKLKIIDVSYGLKIENTSFELWLSPNNYLMLATTIKNNLNEYIKNKLIKESINSNFSLKLEEPLSIMDAELRTIGEISKGTNKNNIITPNKYLMFLENYGFNVIIIDEETMTTVGLNTIKENFKKGVFHSLILDTRSEQSELIKSLVKNYEAEVLPFHSLITLTDEERENLSDYFSIMNKNLETIKKATIG